jgi:hypothetical protein
MKYRKMPSQEYLKSLFDYDPVTGEGFWKQRLSNRTQIGDAVKSINSRYNYKRVCIKGVSYGWHRIAYKIYHGDFDESLEIDHINGSAAGDGIENLRAVKHIQNQRNQKKRVTNTSGVSGVSWSKYRNKWEAYIMDNRKKINLGRFNEYKDAVEARLRANIQYGYTITHGQRAS